MTAPTPDLDTVPSEQYEHEMETWRIAYADLTRKWLEATASRDRWAGIANRLEHERSGA